MKSANSLDYQGVGLLGDLSVSGEVTILALIAIAFFIVGALFGRLSVVHETQAAAHEPATQSVYGRFGHVPEMKQIASPAAAKVH